LGTQTLSAQPPPLPRTRAAAYEEDDDEEERMRAEQATAVAPLEEEEASIGSEPSARSNPSERGALSRETQPEDSTCALQASAWEAESRAANWDAGSFSWDGEPRPSSWGASGGALPSSPSEPAPAKLTARVHHQAVRVAFAPDARSPGQYVVRPLREGEKARGGERVALLVALEPGQPLV
jgi:hypothetical protein